MNPLPRLSWHGFPVTDALATVMGCQTLDCGFLTKPHELVGSGFALPCATGALMSFLASVELFQDKHSIPRPLTSEDFTVVPVAQNGRCFTSCLYVFRLPEEEQQQWASILRSPTSMPLISRTGAVDGNRLRYEETCALSGLMLFLY